ncbi:MAG: rhamnulokinase, partial [Pirellulales bacterium]
MATKTYLAVDLGASSGRHVAGSFDGRRLSLEEIHRFPNGPVPAAGHLYWDLLGLWGHVRDGLRAATGRCEQITSVGVDTWGV